MSLKSANDLEQVSVDTEEALWAWLEAHHMQKESVWLVTYKKAVPDKYVDRFAVLDALIAYGWIDGVRRKKDDTRTMQLIAPRQQQAWAQSYKERADKLIVQGRMKPAGLAVVQAGKANGMWDFYADVDALIVPDDLADALGGVRGIWDGLAPSYRRNVLRWLKQAKTAGTRCKRIDAIGVATRNGRRIPQM